MPAWLPILKAVLPYVANIVTSTVPVFTARRDDEKTSALVQQQISELQSAAGNNAESLRLLAEQVQRMVEALEQSMQASDAALRRAQGLSILAVAVSMLALAVALTR